MDKINKIEQGRKNRNHGKYFEGRVREDLEKKGWICFKNSNNVEKIDTENGQTILFRQTRPKYNPFAKRIIYTGNGFPDYVCIMGFDDGATFKVMFVECKSAKYMSHEEKKKARWLVQNIGYLFYVAYQGKKRGEIIYDQFTI
jgi:predicted Holliday junction resolvase-like endonuclease